MTNIKYTTTPDPTTGLLRITAARDVRPGVPAGTVGGHIESEANLSHEGQAWVSGNALVCGNARVSSNARVSGNARVYGNALVYGYAQVFGNAEVCGDAQVYGNARVSGTARVSGVARVYCDALVSGNARVYGNAQVYEARHVLVVNPTASENITTTATRQADGSIRIRMGCWSGTPAELHILADSDAWPSGCDEATRDLHRPELHAIADLCAAREASWKTTYTKKEDE